MSPRERHISAASAEESIANFVGALVAGDRGRCRIETVRFSGKADDIEVREGQVFLRCLATRLVSNEGEPYELWGRLAGLGGYWLLPKVECEMLALVPEDASDALGAPWLIHMNGDSAPAKLSQGRAWFFVDDETELAFKGKRIVFAVSDDGKATGRTVWLELGPVKEGGGGGLRFGSPWGSLVFDTTGFHVLDRSGAKLSMGGIAGLPPPFNVLGSYVKFEAGICHVAGAQTLLGAGAVHNACMNTPTETATAFPAYGIVPASGLLCSSSVKVAP